MRNNAIFLSRNGVIYRGITYDFDYFLKNILNKKKRNIYIIGEDIYIKVCSISNKKSLKRENIDLLIKRNFTSTNNYLVNYKISRKKDSVYIYAIRGGSYIERLCEAPIEVNIQPIQISILKLFCRISKEKDYVFIFKYMNLYYYIKVKKKYLVESLIASSLEEMKNILDNINESIYVDSEIKGEIKGERINIMERSIYNEKLCRK